MVKAGDIVENSHGHFAKVITAEDGRYGISAFVPKKDRAEDETVIVRVLNEFGLGQVVVPKKTDAKKLEAKKTDAKS